MAGGAYAKKLDWLLRYMACPNVRLAEICGYDPSYISHIRSGKRRLRSGSQSIGRIAEGLYQYADNENLLEALQAICGAKQLERAPLTASLIAWLFDGKAVPEGSRQSPLAGKVKRPHKCGIQEADTDFGLKLKRVMNVLDLSNTQLARKLHVDNSLVSRFRSGLRSPRWNQDLARRMCIVLLALAREKEKLPAFAKLCHLPFDAEADPEWQSEWLKHWLLGNESKEASHVESLLSSLDTFRTFWQEGPLVKGNSEAQSSDFWQDSAKPGLTARLPFSISQGIGRSALGKRRFLDGSRRYLAA